MVVGVGITSTNIAISTDNLLMEEQLGSNKYDLGLSITQSRNSINGLRVRLNRYWLRVQIKCLSR